MTERQAKETIFVFADFHLGEGKNNNLEFFKEDENFYRLVEHLVKEYQDQPIALYLLGDFFDFLSVGYQGKIRAEPTEEAALYKIEKIFSAHPKVILALRNFLKRGKIKFFLGNHDLDLAWDKVQSYIKKKLARNLYCYGKKCQDLFYSECYLAKERISFAFEELKDGVYFIHGNNAEPLNAAPKNIFLTKRLGQPLPSPLLRHPYGNHLIADQVNKMCRGGRIFRGNYWIGRMEPHWYVYLEAIFRNRRFALYAALIWLSMPIRHRFSRRWWVRKSAKFFKLFYYNFSAMLGSIYNKFRGQDYTFYPKTILEEKDAEIIFVGHIHEYRRETTKNGTIIYPGNWSTTYEAQFPKPELKWKRFRRLEKWIKTFLAIRKMFNKKTRRLYQPQKRETLSFGICQFFDDGTKEAKLVRYNREKNYIEEIN